MLALYYSGFVYLRISRKLRGKEPGETEALGFGDVNLSGIIGLLLGWPGILLGLICSDPAGWFCELILSCYSWLFAGIIIPIVRCHMDHFWQPAQ